MANQTDHVAIHMPKYEVSTERTSCSNQCTDHFPSAS